MGVLTENEVRRLLKSKNLDEVKEFEVHKKQIITPAAITFLHDHNISVKYVDSPKNCSMESDNVDMEKTLTSTSVKARYKTIFGAELDEKPEYMTQLHGNILVFKDHPRIALRGKLDSLEGKILETQMLCHKEKVPKLVDDLQEILEYVRHLIRCEVLDESVKDINLQGMDATEIRKMSHYPEKNFGLKYEPVQYTMGEIAVVLNSVRALVRETELMAYKAFKDQYGNVERGDIIKALNRLSSLFWIMIYKYRVGKYS